MRLRSKAAAVTAAAGLAASTMLLATSSPAGAVAHQLCNTGPTVKCLNAWNGGPLVKTYDPNFTNDNFDYQPVQGRCRSGSAFTTSGCPVSGTPSGLEIVQIQYFNTSGACVGDNANLVGDAKAAEVSGFCNSTTSGTGGAWGSLFLIDPIDGCPSGSFGLVNVHWSSSWANRVWLGFPGNSVNGTQWYLNTGPDNSSCLHQGA